jgi:glycosyltransferase involved in cell wall biosynthesis
MVTLIYNISDPERGGVGRYTYELLMKLRKKIKFNEIDLSPSFGKSYLEKLSAIIWKRKRFLLSQKDKFSEVNHFLLPQIFYDVNQTGKTIITFHSGPPFTGPYKLHNFFLCRDYYSLIKIILIFKRYKEALEKVDFLIANSKLTEECCIEAGVDKNIIKVIPFGIDENFKINTNFNNRKNIIGYVGSFAFHKRVDKLLKDWKENFNKLSKYKLHLYGSGGVQFKSLKKRYHNKHNIKFLGMVKKGGIIKAYNSFCGLVFPSKWESFGLPIIEAIACGSPVFIYKDAEITPEVRKYGIEIDSVLEIPEILENIDTDKLKKLSREVKEEFNWNKHVGETIKIYKMLASS